MQFVMTMPVYNEAEGIVEFLSEIVANCGPNLNCILIVDDHSTDQTARLVEAFAGSSPVELTKIQTPRNSGHGPATLCGMNYASKLGLPVITLDGDGQFKGSEILEALNSFSAEKPDVLEGIRVHREHEPVFRQFTSSTTRVLVWLKTRKWAPDANTPMRIYSPGVLSTLLTYVPPESATPNLLISAMLRKSRFLISEKKMIFLPRRGRNEIGRAHV